MQKLHLLRLFILINWVYNFLNDNICLKLLFNFFIINLHFVYF